MRSEAELTRAIDRYADTIKRICFLHLKNQADTEDIFQTVFLKYYTHPQVFEGDEHEKAWLIRVTVNACNDLLRSFARRQHVPLDAVAELAADEQSREVLTAVLALPKKYRDAIYLFYYEGYTAREIGDILNKKENTIYTLLARGREQLKTALGGEDIG